MGLISRVAIVITHIQGLIALLNDSYPELPSRATAAEVPPWTAMASGLRGTSSSMRHAFDERAEWCNTGVGTIAYRGAFALYL